MLECKDEDFCLLVKHHPNWWKSNGLPKKKRSKFHLCETTRQTSAWCHATTVNISSVKNTALASRGAQSGNCSCPLSTHRIERHLPGFPPLCATCHRRENNQNDQHATFDSRWTRGNFTVRRFGRFLGPFQACLHCSSALDALCASPPLLSGWLQAAQDGSATGSTHLH